MYPKTIDAMNKIICVIIPAYNEEKRLQIDSFQTFATQNSSVHLLLVNDGSTDQTAITISQITAICSNVSLLDLPTNKGKGNAVKEGMCYAIKNIPARYYAYLDADLSTPFTELFLLQNELEKDEKLLMVFGSRIMKMGSKISRKAYRHYLGRVVATFISLQLGLAIYDTQCGAKMFKATIVNSLFDKPFISQWLFDVEIFNRLLILYPKIEVQQKIKEIALNTWEDVDGSKIGVLDTIRTPIDLFKIAIYYAKNK